VYLTKSKESLRVDLVQFLALVNVEWASLSEYTSSRPTTGSGSTVGS
jgi:hypothetical protein